MQFADLELARRIEKSESLAATFSPDDPGEQSWASRVSTLKIMGGIATYAGKDSPLTQAIGLALSGPVTAEEVEQLEEFFRSRGSAVNIELCPLADDSLVGILGKRGYRVTEFTNVLVRPLRNGDLFSGNSPCVEIHAIAPEEGALWAQTVTRGFAEHFPVPPELLEVMQLFTAKKDSQCFLARVDDKPAGGAAMGIRKGLAALYGASTLPEFRGRGVQTSLICTRLQRAVQGGCKLVYCLTRPASISQRNIERLGFEVIYTRAKFTREF
ncbi:MAG: GNAT family N-acetyltransferase [Candidatus Acidiferrales bacterium]